MKDSVILTVLQDDELFTQSMYCTLWKREADLRAGLRYCGSLAKQT